MRTFRFVLATALAALGLSIVGGAPPAGAAVPAALNTFDQCQNQNPAPYTTCSGWTNGGLNNSNHYAEDMVVPQRASFATTPGVDYVFSVTYDFVNGTKHGYDYLATWNASISGATPCQAPLAASQCSGAPTVLAMIHDPLVGTHDVGIPANWTLYGGVLTATTQPTHSGNQATTTVTFHSNPGVTSVVLLFGGHLAVGTPASAPRSWGNGNGASSFPGGSLSIRQTGSSRNNGINTNAIAPLPAAAFTITKTATPTSAGAGDLVTYKVTVTNTGGVAGTATFTDDYNNNLTNVSTPSGCTQGTGSAVGSMTCTTNSLAPTTSQTFTYTANLPTSFTGAPSGSPCTGNQFKVSNTATFATGTNVTTGQSNSVTANVCVNAASTFSIDKTPRVTTAVAGGNVTYDVIVTNTGSAPGSTSFTDNYDDAASTVTLPSNCTDATVGTDKKFTCTTGTLNPGQSETITYTMKMPTSFTGSPSTACTNGGYAVVNGVAITGGASDTSTVCVTASPTFTIDKTPRTSTAVAGGNVTYDVIVTNTGTGPGSTSFTDNYNDAASTVTLPSNCTDTTVGTDKKFTCTTGTINPGGTETITYTMKMPTSFTGNPGTTCTNGGYPVVNGVAITGGASDTSTVCVTVTTSFTIDKAPRTSTAVAGGNVTYDVIVTNTGSGPGSTSFTDNYNDAASTVTLPSNCTDATVGTDKKFTCTTGTINPGQSETITYTMKMPSTFTGSPIGCTNGGYPVINNVAITGGATDSSTVCVTTSPLFSVTKTPRVAAVAAGANVTYDVVVSNTGSGPGSTSFTDNYNDAASTVTLPSNCTDTTVGTDKKFTCTTGVIDPGQTETITYTMKMPSSFTGTSTCDGGYPVLNQVTGAAGTATGTVCVSASPTFTIDKTPRTSTAVAGGNVTYDVIVSNTGSGPGSTSFTDNYNDAASTVTLPSNCTDSTVGTDKQFTCTTGTINPGGSETITYTLKMPSTFTGSPSTTCTNGGYAVSNQVTITGGASDSSTVCVTASPTFTITKEANSLTSAVNGTITYTVTVRNIGSGPGIASFTDNYNDNATAVTPLAQGCVDSTVGTDKKFTCTTGTINPGLTQVFVYDIKMPASFAGTPTGCAGDDFPVSNTVTLASGGNPATVTVCVDATPTFTIVKTPRSTTAGAGDNVIYDVVVTNNGSAPGATSFTDNYNDNASTVTLPSNCVDATVGTDKRFTCTTGTINPGLTETVTYTLKMPSTFTGTPTGCTNGGYPVVNTVTITGSSSDSGTVCVAAAPAMNVTKTGTVAFDSNGDQIITYTINYSNTGPAEANAVTITDQLPTGTAFYSCSGNCTTAGNPTTVTWSVAPVAPLTGTGSVELKVRVTTNQTCSISNTAQVKLGGVTAATSAPAVVNVTPVPDPTTAKSNGSAIGVQVKTKGLLQLVVGLVNAVVVGSGNNQVLLIGQTSSSQTGPGGPTANEAHLLSLNITGIINAGVVRETSASVVTTAPAETRQTSTSEVASVCLVPVAGICTVRSDTLRAVASTMANGSFAAVSSAGSTIENLYVNNVLVPVDLNQTTKIPLNAAIFGANSYVAINERTSSAGLVSGRYAADMTVSMIHVKITNLALIGALDVVVAQATAHSDFPKTLVCSGGTHQQSVSGHAYNAKLYTGPLLADLLLGFVQISPLGGAETEHVVSAVIPSTGVIVNAQVADSSSVGGFTPTASTARSWAEIVGDGGQTACVLSYVTDCVVKATLIRSEARSTATSAGSTSTDTGTSFVGLKVFGIPISANVAPNSTLVLPGIGFIILNEQFCDNGAAASHSCSAAGHTGITVRAVRVVVTVANNILHLNPGVELIVSEAHADSTFY